MRNRENESQQQISSLTYEKATLQRDLKEAYDNGVRMGIEQFVTTKSVNLPGNVDAESLSGLIKDVFEKVHSRKKKVTCAAVAAAAIWDLYEGRCRQDLRDWTEEDIRKRNLYRQAKEIAKVMDTSPGQLNLSGYKAL
jgi:hypothetical protein